MTLSVRDIVVGAVLLMLLGLCIIGQVRINNVSDRIAISERVKALEQQTIINTNDIKQIAGWINQQAQRK